MKRRGLVTFVLLGIMVFAGLVFYGDSGELLDQVSSFPIEYWLIALGFALTNYALRLARWTYYLRLLDIHIDAKSNVAIFVSGLSMAISPGRVGELAKSYFLKEKFNVPVATSSAAVITERITDLIAVVFLSLWGLILIPHQWGFVLVIVSTVLLGAFIVFVVSSWGSDKILRFPVPRKWRPFIEESREAFRCLFAPKPLLFALILGVLAWLAEGAAMWFVLRGLDTGVSFTDAVSVYAVATLLGAATMLPGGLVGTEGSMVALLQQLDLTKTLASSGTFIIRLSTLWFAVVLGLLGLAYMHFTLTRNRPDIGPVLQGASEHPGESRFVGH